MANTRRSRLYIDVSLAAIAVITIIVYFISNRFLYYRLGLGCFFGTLILLGGSIILMLKPIALVLLLVLIIRGFILNVRFGIKRLLLQIFLITISIALFAIVPKCVGKFGGAAFTEGFLERMKKEADVPTIQAWVDNLDLDNLKDCKVDEDGWRINEAGWPDAIKKFSSENVNVLCMKSKNDKTYVRVLFGTALLGYWSLVVGVGSDEIPLNDYYESEYRLELASNAFVGYCLEHKAQPKITSAKRQM
jgi:hypothetical protein